MNTTMTIRIDPKIVKSLDNLAGISKSSRSAIATEAISQYIEIQEWQIAGIKEALKEVQDENILSHSEVLKWTGTLKGNTIKKSK